MNFFEKIIHLPNKIIFPFFSKNKSIYNEFQKKGFLHYLDNKENLNLCRYVMQNLKKDKIEMLIKKNIKNFPKKYSINIAEILDENIKTKLVNFFNSKEQIDKTSSMLGYKTKFRDVSLIVNFYNKNTSLDEGAKMFHRDSDSLQDQVKIFMLINDIDDDCGMFYYVPNNYFPPKNKLPFEKNRFHMKLSDRWRNYDDTMNKVLIKKKFNPKNAIKKLQGKQGEIIYIDTGKVYHKGGYVKNDKKIRILLQAVYTPRLSLSNWNGNKNKSLRYFQQKLTSFRIKLRKNILTD